MSRSHLTQRDRDRAGERKRQSKILKGEQCFPQTALERVERFGRSCQETLCQAASSSTLFLVWTNLAALCSLSYLATAPQHCGPLPQARIKLGYPRLNSLLKNHLGVIPVWSQPRMVQHIISLTMTIIQSRLHALEIQETSMRKVRCVLTSDPQGCFKLLYKMRLVHLRWGPEFWLDVFHLSD